MSALTERHAPNEKGGCNFLFSLRLGGSARGFELGETAHSQEGSVPHIVIFLGKPYAQEGSVPHIVIFLGKPYAWMPLSLPKFWVFQ